MKPSRLKRPSPAESAKALAETLESQRIRDVTPKRDEVLSALGRGSLRTNPDGSWAISVTKDSWPVEKNRKRLGAVRELMRSRRAMQTERSERHAAERQTVRVRGPMGDLREIPIEMEGAVARKPGFRPAPKRRWSERTVWHADGSRTTYYRDGRVEEGT